MEFLILDTNFVAVETLDTYESFIWTDRYSSFGDFELYLAPTVDNLRYLREDYYLWIEGTDHSMIIEDIDIRSDVEDGNKLLVSGRSLESLLTRRIVWDQTALSGNFQNGIKRLIDESIITPNDEDRAIPNFVFELSSDPKVTELTVDIQFTGDNLYEAIKKLCDTHDLGFKVILNDTNQFVFSLYSGVDRSYNQTSTPYIVFSPDFDNLINSNYVSSKRALKTVTLVAGEGEGSARKKTIAAISSGAGRGLERRELYTDARDISSNNGETPSVKYFEQLVQRGHNKLSESTIVKAFEGKVDAQQKFVYGQDFFMGDIVQISNEYGIESTSRVTELVQSQDVSGYEVFPTFTTIE